MKRCTHHLLGVVLLGALAFSSIARAQSVAPTITSPASTVPRSVPFTAQVATPKGDARTGSVMLTFGLYTDQKEGTPIWTEQQVVSLDADGRYSVILGSTSADGLPANAFAAGTPRWLGVRVEGEKEQARFMLLSVPYALKAGDADTVAGKAASDFVLSSNLSDSVKSAIKESKDATSPNDPMVTTNALVKYANSGGAQTESSVVDVGGKVGIQVAAPGTELDIAGFGSSTTITLRNGASAADVMKLVGSDGTLRIGSATHANLINLIGPEVGIGTTEPFAQLHVAGGLFADANSTPAGFYNYAAILGFGGPGGSALNGRCPIPNQSCWGIDASVTSGNNFSGVFTGGSGVKVNGQLQVIGNLTVTGAKSGYVVDAMQNADSSPLEPGDVVVIVGSAAPVLGQIPVPTVKKARAAYDTGVAGVVDQALYVPDAATKAAYEAWSSARRARQETRFDGSGTDKPPIAIAGASGDVHATDDDSVGTGGYASVVTLGSFKLIKVDASFGAIHAGDLLTTSINPGHAMKVTDKLAAMGAVIGKALADFESGSGTIPVLVTLK